jgi:hypothetical protein
LEEVDGQSEIFEVLEMQWKLFERHWEEAEFERIVMGLRK